MRGSAERHYGKRNISTLDNNNLIAEYRIVIHIASRRSQKAARYIYNASGLATSFNLLELLASENFRSVSKDYINVSQTKAGRNF